MNTTNPYDQIIDSAAADAAEAFRRAVAAEDRPGYTPNTRIVRAAFEAALIRHYVHEVGDYSLPHDGQHHTN